ncbi:MAG: hypothetical protein KatS3mg003_1152 [Candidatus Nitrosocaldaceae archaeon]|nr:MAG: hypothetical protein KatS3mg003_1152 [Candidatus Nitrosocaldaceae archaeon]
MPYRSYDIDRYIERVAKNGECYLTKDRADIFFNNAASILGISLLSYEESKKIEKPKVMLSDILKEMRAKKYEDISR